MVRLKKEAENNHVIGNSFYRRRIHLIEQLKQILKRLKMKTKGYGLHTFRHTFGSNLVMAGVDLPTVARLMGHANIAMAMRYSHLAPSHLNRAVQTLEIFYSTSEENSGSVLPFAK
jgi:site-specific recombinase XerD